MLVQLLSPTYITNDIILSFQIYTKNLFIFHFYIIVLVIIRQLVQVHIVFNFVLSIKKMYRGNRWNFKMKPSVHIYHYCYLFFKQSTLFLKQTSRWRLRGQKSYHLFISKHFSFFSGYYRIIHVYILNPRKFICSWHCGLWEMLFS